MKTEKEYVEEFQENHYILISKHRIWFFYLKYHYGYISFNDLVFDFGVKCKACGASMPIYSSICFSCKAPNDLYEYDATSKAVKDKIEVIEVMLKEHISYEAALDRKIAEYERYIANEQKAYDEFEKDLRRFKRMKGIKEENYEEPITIRNGPEEEGEP